MQITEFQLGQLGANCYVVADEKAKVCAVVDPGGQGEQLADWLEREGLQPQAVFLTHGHYDHVGGAKALADRYGISVYLHPGDTALSPELCHGLYWNAAYKEADAPTVGELTFRVLHTPGHTPGSVCLQVGDVLLTGDTLFAGSCGRTDFPGGNWQEMLQSLNRLGLLEGNYQVLSGHGEASDLNRERQYNPYMKEAGKG